MSGKTVARDSLLLRTGRSYSYLFLPRKKPLRLRLILAQKLSLHQHHEQLECHVRWGSRLNFSSRIQTLIQIFELHLNSLALLVGRNSLALLVGRNRDERSLVSLKT